MVLHSGSRMGMAGGAAGDWDEATATWVPPAVFEGYRLVRPLGAGGMGRVYLCHDLLLDRPVAIKFIAHSDPDGRRRERFLLEGRALARLVHANVVFTFRVGDVEGRPFLVSEFVEGSSLDKLERPVHWRRALDIGMGLARGLAAAHRAGILHRDVKPQNAMLTPENEVKLIDFGLAIFVAQGDEAVDAGVPVRSTTASAGETESDADAAVGLARRDGEPLSRVGAVLGTRRYMAPERLEGKPASRQSDVFSLGCVLRELCGDDVATGSGGERPPEVDPQFRRIIDSCLERELARRCPSADELLRAMEALADDTAAFGAVPTGNPYRGLESFDVAHRALFLGRSQEVAAIVEKLRTERVVVVAGDSGVGKSSICKAGVIPRLEESTLLPGRQVRVVQLVPGREPLVRLARALAEVVSDDPHLVHERLLAEPTEVLRALGRAPNERTVVIFVDQVEELFTLASPVEAARFAEILASLALSGSLLRVLLGVRGDFLARLAALPGIGAEVARAPYLLRPLSADKLREVIVVPARRSGVAFVSPVTIDDLVRFAMSSEGALPLLQFTLAELWEARNRETNVIGIDTLAALGGVDGTFERHADRTLGALPSTQLGVARRLLCRFVTAQGTRASLTRDEVRQRTEDERALLETLIVARLIVVRGGDDLAIYELAHEALITKWSALRRWLEEDLVQKRALERLASAAKEWDHLGRRGDGLWTGRQLAGVEGITASELAPREREFLAASRVGRRKARLIRIAIPLAATCLLLLAIVVGRVRARAEIDNTVARSLAGARELEAGARKHDDQAQQLRVTAMRLFDEGAGLLPGGARENSWRDAESIWSRVMEAESEAEVEYGRATTTLESALFVDPPRSTVREELVQFLDVRLGLAERMFHRELRAELSERLRSLRLTGGNRAAEADEATLALTRSSGVDVAVTIAPYVADASGRLTLGASRPLKENEQRLPPGSYLLTAALRDCPAVHIPVLLERHEGKRLVLPSPAECSVPRGFILVAASDSFTGSDQEDVRAGLEDAPIHTIHLPTFLVGRFKVTIGEYITWLETLSPRERTQHAPNSRADPSSVVLRRGAHDWSITLKPATKTYVSGWGEPIHYQGRSTHALQDWRRFPVTGISFNEAAAYATWLGSTRDIAGAHVCRDVEWEKAARGADGRTFTTGRSLQPSDADFLPTYGGTELALGPDEVGSHPQSRSPYGAEDVHGNTYEMVTSSRWNQEMAVFGGSWDREQVGQRLDNRFRIDPSSRNAQIGFRICATATRHDYNQP